MVEYRIKGNVYKVTRCSLVDIDSDYELVRANVDDCPEDEYKAKMIKSIESGTTYRVIDANGKLGFLYSYIEDKVGYGSAGYNGGLRIGYLCLLKELVKDYPSHKMVMMPHKGNIGYIRSLATNNSIRDCHNGNGPLVVLISELKAKIDDLWAKLGLV